MSSLSSERSGGTPLATELADDLPHDAEELVVRVALGVSRRLAEITAGMREALADAIAELVGDYRLLDLLGEAIEGNVGTILHMLRAHTPLHELTVPAAAVAHARRLAQQGISVFAMVRAYRLGQAYLLKECYAELGDQGAESALALPAFNAINERMLSYIDWVSQEVVTAYETERDQWVRNQDAVRAARIQEILDGHDDTEVREAETLLRYRLRQNHIAAVVWSEDDTSAGSLSQLEAAVHALSGALGNASDALTVASNRNTTWVWFPRGDDNTEPDIAQLDRSVRLAECGNVRVAISGAATGIEGFRETHREAIRVRGVVTAGAAGTRRVVGYREPGVAAAAVLSRDLDQTRTLVHSALGSLAAADDSTERLRETLLGFLESGSSFSATAARINLHKNSVRYRVDRALELRGRPLGDDRIDVQLALIACRWLPGPCLGDPPVASRSPVVER